MSNSWTQHRLVWEGHLSILDFRALLQKRVCSYKEKEKENEEKNIHKHSNSMIKTDDDDDDGGDNNDIYNDYDVDKNAPEIQ